MIDKDKCATCDGDLGFPPTKMQFDQVRLPNQPNEMRVWKAWDGQRSYIITHDAKHPGNGYVASWSPDGKKKTMLPRCATLSAAKRECKRVSHAMAN